MLLNGVLWLPYCADSGAERSCISRAMFQKLVSLCNHTKSNTLSTPIECQGVGGTKISVAETTYLRLSLQTAAGAVNIDKPVEVYIIEDASDDEFILGNDVLTLLGIDVDRQIEMMAGPSHLNGDDLCDDDVTPTKVHSDDDLSVAIEAMMQKALAAGFPGDKVDRLAAIVNRFDIWRVALGDDPPAKVPPMKVRLKTDAKPYRCKARKYPPELQRFLEEFNQELVDLGWVYENPNNRWACPALPVKKAGGNEYRQTTDYKPVNAMVDVMAGTMPNVQVDLENVKDCECYGLFDFLKGYWQLPLAKESQEVLSYMTHRKIYTPTRVPQGCSDAALFFQSTIEKCCEPLLRKHLLVWIDDLLLYAGDIDTYLDKLEELFGIMNRYGFKLSAKKSELYKTKVKWCGKVIDGRGVSHDPERIEALQDLPYPTNAGELQQFLCATNWMRESIVDYARLVRPLQDVLDAALATSRKRTKRAATRLPIDLTSSDKDVYDKIKERLSHVATLAFPREEATMCLLTDASDVGWSVIVTQVRKWVDGLPVEQQAHELLVCSGGTFTGAQRNWSVIEKEAYPIVMACDKLSYLLLRPKGFRMYCDHRNLIHLFAPGSEMKKHVRGKLLRWSVKLMDYRYTIEHVEGVSNVWADMISRWAGNHVPVVAIKRVTTRRGKKRPRPTKDSDAKNGSQVPIPAENRIRPFLDGDLVWPTVAEIRAAQEEHVVARPRHLRQDMYGVWLTDDLIWIPAEAKTLVQRLLVIAHCGSQGHRGRDALLAVLHRRFYIQGLRSLVDSFPRSACCAIM